MNTIRRATEKDIEGLKSLLLQVDMVHHNGRPDVFKGPAMKYSDEELKLLLKDDSRPVFVCVDSDDNVLGHAFVVFKQEKSHNILTDIKTLYIDDICVDENARRQSVGKNLYEYVIAFARANDCYNVTLNVWKCNEGAIKFYEKMGMDIQRIFMETII